MLKSLFLFLKRNYKLFSIVFFLVAFFFVYNIFLVDRSLVNLQIALNSIAEAKTPDDLAKIKSLLKVPILKELAKKKTSSEAFLAMEVVENIANSKDPAQLQDAKFYLERLIEEKEKTAGGFLDRLNARIYAPETQLSREKLESEMHALLARIKSTRDEKSLQAAYYELGNVYVQLSDMVKAQEAFLQSIKIDPKSDLSLKAKFNLAWAYKSSGEYDKAVVYFEELGRESPDLELAIVSEYQVADSFYKKGEYEAAREKYAGLAARNAKFQATADKLSESGAIPPEYLEGFKSTLRFLNQFSLLQAGNISLFELGNLEDAARYFSELEKDYPSSDFSKHVNRKTRILMSTDLRRTGFKLLREKKYIEAIGKFEKAVEVAPADAQSFSGIGLGFYWLNEKPKALDTAGKAVEIAQQDEIALINSLFIYVNAGKLDEAIRIGEEAAKVFIPRAEFYYNLGYAYLLKGIVGQARANLERSIRINPDFIFSYNNLGCALWMATAYSEAIQKFQEAIGIDPAYVNAHFNLGVVYLNLKRLEEAYKEFETVLQLNPDYQEAREYLKLITQTLQYQP